MSYIFSSKRRGTRKTHFSKYQNLSLDRKVLVFLTGTLHFLQEEYSNIVIETYVEELIKDKQYSLIAFYVSKLPPNAQVHWYAKFLEGKYLHENMPI